MSAFTSKVQQVWSQGERAIEGFKDLLVSPRMPSQRGLRSSNGGRIAGDWH